MTLEFPFVLSYAALWLLVIFQSLVLLGLVRTVYKGGSAPAFDSPAPSELALRGQPMPEFSAVDVSGASFSDRDLADRPSVLLFVSPDCASCAVTLKELDGLKEKVDGNLILFCRSAAEPCRRLIETYGLSVPMVVDEDLRLSTLFHVNGAPTAVLIGEDGRIQNYGHPLRGGELVGLVPENETPLILEEVQ